MSAYTISLKSIINFYSHVNNNDDVFNNTPLKIQRGREIFFNYNYTGKDNVEFSELFENEFIINYFTRDIYCEDIELFMASLQNEVKIKSKMYYPQWVTVSEKLADLYDKIGVVEGESKSTTKNKNKTLSSQFPQDVLEASDFSDVGYMDSGGMADGEGIAEATQTSTEYNSKITHVIELFEAQSKDIIAEFIKSLHDLFMGVY